MHTQARASSIVSETLRFANTEGAQIGLQPMILVNQNINPCHVTELTSCYVNEGCAPKIKELIDSGWILFRIQTEFGFNGHNTLAYFAKLKPA